MKRKPTNRDLKRDRAHRPHRFAPECGTSLLEMALVLPILLLLLMGILDIGRYAEFSILMANAAHAGAQYGAQSVVNAADSTGIANAAVSDAQSALTASGVSSSACVCNNPGVGTTCTFPCSSGAALTYVQVTTTGTFHSLFGYVGLTSSVSKTANMRVAE